MSNPLEGRGDAVVQPFYYQDMFGNTYIKVAENATETFIAPVKFIDHGDAGHELSLDYSNIKAFSNEMSESFIEEKYTYIDGVHQSYKLFEGNSSNTNIDEMGKEID